MSKQNAPVKEAETQTAQAAGLSPRRKSALVLYLAALFVVAMAVVALSMGLQNHNLQDSNASAMGKAEALQDENRALSDSLTQANESLAQQSQALSQAESDLAAEKAAKEALQQQLTDTAKAYDLLMQAKAAQDQGDQESLTQILAELEPLKENLSDTAREEYTRLQENLA